MNLSDQQVITEYPFDSKSFDIFHSDCVVDGATYTFTRHVDDLKWETTSIYVNGENLGPGEDPRAFDMLGMPACFCVVFNQYSGTFIPVLYFMVDGTWTGMQLRTPADLKVGKNWMPFTYNNEVYFVHSVSPFRLLKLSGDTVETVFVQDIPSDALAFDQYPSLRGGCNALQVNEDHVMGFGHYTRSGNGTDIKTIYHRPYTWHLDMSQQQVEIKDLDYMWDTDYNIVDPTALIQTPNGIKLMTCETNLVWGVSEQQGRSCIYKINL